MLLLDYGKRPQAYWIRCADCEEYYSEHPEQFELLRKHQDQVEKRAAKEGHVW